MADSSTVSLSEPHPPKPPSVEAFQAVLPEIKNGLHKARQRWDEHEPEMFARVKGHTDHELLEHVNLEKDLVEVRTGESAYNLIPVERLTLDMAYICSENSNCKNSMMRISTCVCSSQKRKSNSTLYIQK